MYTLELHNLPDFRQFLPLGAGSSIFDLELCSIGKQVQQTRRKELDLVQILKMNFNFETIICVCVTERSDGVGEE